MSNRQLEVIRWASAALCAVCWVVIPWSLPASTKGGWGVLLFFGGFLLGLPSAMLVRGFGDTDSMRPGLENPIPTATVFKENVGWHEMKSGQLTFTFPAGALSKTEMKEMQRNLNQEQKLFQRRR